MPAARDQSAEPPALRRGGVGVHGLRVIAPGELDDLGFADGNRAGGEHRARRVVLEIALGSQAHRGSPKSMTWTSSLAVSKTAQLSWERLALSRGSPAGAGVVAERGAARAQQRRWRAQPGWITKTAPMRQTTWWWVSPYMTTSASASAKRARRA